MLVWSTWQAKARVRIPSHLIISRGILSPILSPLILGVNAGRTTSLWLLTSEPRGE
jgi:hypothetical protein